MRQVAAEPRWRTRLDGVLRHDAVATPGRYHDLLRTAGLRVDALRTEHLRVPTGTDPVPGWVRATGLRPVWRAMTLEDAADFQADYEADYAARPRRAYPKRPGGTVFAFRRTFVVAH